MKCQQNYLKNSKGSKSFLFSIENKKTGNLFPANLSYYLSNKERRCFKQLQKFIKNIIFFLIFVFK